MATAPLRSGVAALVVRLLHREAIYER